MYTSIMLYTIYIPLLALHTKVFMFQRTLRKLDIDCIDRSYLYPPSYLKLYRISLLRYIILGFMFFYNVWIGVSCIVLEFIFPIIPKEQNDYANILKSIQSLRKVSNPGVLVEKAIAEMYLADILHETESNFLKFDNLYDKYDNMTIMPLLSCIVEDFGIHDMHVYAEYVENLGDGTKEQFKKIRLRSWENRIISLLGTAMFHSLIFRDVKERLRKEWENEFCKIISEYEAVMVLRNILIRSANNILKNEHHAAIKNTYKIDLGKFITENGVMGISLGQKQEDCINIIKSYGANICISRLTTVETLKEFETVKLRGDLKVYNICMSIIVHIVSDMAVAVRIRMYPKKDCFFDIYESVLQYLVKKFGDPTESRNKNKEFFVDMDTYLYETKWKFGERTQLSVRRCINGDDWYLDTSVEYPQISRELNNRSQLAMDIRTYVKTV